MYTYKTFWLVLTFLSAIFPDPLHAQSPNEDSRIVDRITTETPINGVSTTPSGRVFLLYARIDNSTGPTVVEYNTTTNVTTPYPNLAWNTWSEGQNVSEHFVRINAQRIGPEGDLYIVDTGSPGFGEEVIPNGIKVVQVNVSTDQVVRVYHLDNVTYPLSLLDDIRFNGPTAYLTDAGVPGLIVLDRESGQARRVLNDTVSTRGAMPVSAEGRLVHAPAATGKEYLFIYADQLEVSPDGMYFYYQPSCGGMYRIETKYLDNENYTSLTDDQLESYAEPFALTPSTGGTAIDAQGNIYVSDTNWMRILKVAPNGTMSVLLQDPRLLWIDAMWIDGNGTLWMPSAQLNRGVPFNNGTSLLDKPLHVYTFDLGVGPPSNDHA